MSIDLCQVPAWPAPEGTTSNFENPTTLVPAFMSLTGITITIAIILTGARLYVNFRKLTWADYFAVIALLISIAALGVEAAHLKTARHIWDVPACFFDGSFAINLYFSGILFQIGQFFAKASIFLLFSQLFTIHRPMRIAIWVGLALDTLIYWPGFAVSTYYQTPRIGETWLDTLDGRNVVALSWWQAQSALIVSLDIYIFVLPLPTLTRLQLPTKKRVSLVAMFSVALIGIAASIASLVQRVIVTDTDDTTWIKTILSLCSFLELNAAIIVSSAPAFASFARSHLPEIAAIKTFFSSLTSFTAKTRGSESMPSSGFKGENTAFDYDKHAKQHQDHHYYELNEACVLESGASAAQGGTTWVPSPPTVPGDGGIVRTMAFEQTVKSSQR